MLRLRGEIMMYADMARRSIIERDDLDETELSLLETGQVQLWQTLILVRGDRLVPVRELFELAFYLLWVDAKNGN